MAVERAVREILQQVLDVKPEEIKPDVGLDKAFGVDSTEMVEIAVGIKKKLGIDMANNELKKNQSFSQIVTYLKGKGIK